MSVNTICPKQGQHQWSCTRDECTCHLKEEIPITNPIHGGKVTCRLCGSFIDTEQRYIKRGSEYEHLWHGDCQ